VESGDLGDSSRLELCATQFSREQGGTERTTRTRDFTPKKIYPTPPGRRPCSSGLDSSVRTEWPRCTTTDQRYLILPMNTSTHQLRVQLDVRTGVQVARRGAGAVSPVDLCGYLSRPHPSRGQLHPTAAYAAEPGATRRNSQSIASNDTPLDWVQPGQRENKNQGLTEFRRR